MSEQLSKEAKLKLINQKLNAVMQKKGLSLATSIPPKPLEKQTKTAQNSNDNKQEQNNQKKEEAPREQQNMPKKTKKIQKPEPTQKLEKEHKNKNLRKVAGMVWEDKTMEEWPENDYRIFVGNLGKEVNDDTLGNAFRFQYKSFNMARVIIDRRTGMTRGYGFVSFSQPRDFLNVLKQMNGKYIGSKPVKIMKSSWKDRNIDSAKNQFLPSDFKTNSKKQTHKINLDFKYQYPM